MSILIKGMKKPKNCYDCPLHYGHADCSYAEVMEHGGVLKTICPMVELPDHGDLVERDEIGAWIDNWFEKERYYHPYSKGKSIPTAELVDAVKQMPVVIPAERE